MEYRICTKNKDETIELAEKFASLLNGGNVVLLTGDLGAGKTTFVKGVGKFLGVKEDIISPTFNILKCYFECKPNLFHIDAYRLENANKDIGLEEFIESDGITFIEWPIFIEEFIPQNHLEISIKNIGGDSREFTFKSVGTSFDTVIEKLEGICND